MHDNVVVKLTRPEFDDLLRALGYAMGVAKVGGEEELLDRLWKLSERIVLTTEFDEEGAKVCL
jgi:hypothetical protein